MGKSYYRSPDSRRRKQTALWTAQSGKCALCAVDCLPFGNPEGRAATVDHITPLSQGGSRSDMSNLQMTCRNCNELKGEAENGVGDRSFTLIPQPEFPLPWWQFYGWLAAWLGGSDV